ncbi:hypothetical protein [Vibrio campbellii]|uniref:hypothetical protein n=1 Tax=Vibrio campbellii TaxID=680 RepID=UPI00039F3813|nr:hypothetical protein [Vibrio campbellii]
MSKHPNPIRGHVSCPVCSSHATVHRVGEGKLIAEGEPTKNGRNLGLLYYKCPSCGNSPMSKSINSFVESNMVESVEQLNTPELSDAVTNESDISTVEPVVETVESTDTPSLEQNEVVTVKVQESESPMPVKQRVFPVKKVLAGLAIVALLLWAVRQLIPAKKATDEPTEQGEPANAG